MLNKKDDCPKLKIVFVVTASRIVPWHLNNTLRRITADFDVCVVGQGVSENQGEYPNVTFVDIDIHRRTSPIADFLALIAICRFFLSYKPDIVHSIMPKAGLLAALAGFVCRVPVRIHTFTGQVWVVWNGLSRHFYYAVDRLINQMNSVCLTDSISQSVFLHEHKISYLRRPLPVLSKGSLSGVDVARFDLTRLENEANKLRVSLGIGKGNFVFAFIARKVSVKGAFDVLKAFASVSHTYNHVRLLFVGPDEYGDVERLHKSNPEMFVNVIDVGHVKNHEVYLAITDVLCLPSYHEGFGSIVIDAAAMGIPTIGTRIPGLIDSIEDQKSGVLIPAGDVDKLVKVMLAFVENPPLRQTMGSYAKARVDEFFAADRLYDALKKLYLEMISKR